MSHYGSLPERERRVTTVNAEGKLSTIFFNGRILNILPLFQFCFMKNYSLN